MNDRLTNSIKKIFELPNWYLPSETEINKLFTYVRNEGNIRRAKSARSLDCSAFCPGTDCYFCMDIYPVFKCCAPKYQTMRQFYLVF